MRTKTLLLTAALSAASLLSSMAAGVTSVNVVGYINVSVPLGFSFIANQLRGASLKVSDVIPNPPAETVLYSWDGGFSPNSYDGAAWDFPDSLLAPGSGSLVYAKSAFTVTFVGEVLQGSLSTPLPKGFSFVSSQVPQAGKITTDLGLATAGAEDVVYTWDGGFTPNGYDGAAWDSGEPVLAVGQSVLYYRKGEPTAWTRSFIVP